jgi:hypothetical protein
VKTHLVVVFMLLAGCSSSESPGSSTARSLTPTHQVPILSPAGFGPIEFGMKVEEAEHVAGLRSDPRIKLNRDCDYIQFLSLPGVRFMVESGVLTRGDASPNVANSLGISVGTKLEVVKATYPEAEIIPHKYDPKGHYIMLGNAQSRNEIVIEEGGGSVIKIRAGLQASARYVEGCL